MTVSHTTISESLETTCGEYNGEFCPIPSTEAEYSLSPNNIEVGGGEGMLDL